MASPPRAGSPPSYLNGSSLNLARKRPSVSASGRGTKFQRRSSLASSAANSAHPLRQTSFPPPESAYESRASSFSPPVDELIPGPSRASTIGRKRRGGKKGGLDGRSQAGTSAAGTRNGKDSQVNGAGLDTEYPDEEDDDDDGGFADDTVLEGGAMASEAQMKLERENLRMLVEAFSNDQIDQYTLWRRVRLRKATVKRLVNQTLSQSVPDSVVTTVSGYTKLFIGELIERAREVQTEWLAATPLRPIDEALVPKTSQTGQIQDALNVEADKGRRNFEVLERDKGPLLPEHLREALRRYKRDREGGSTGFHGLSLNGSAKVASRMGGKRLFK